MKFDLFYLYYLCMLLTVADCHEYTVNLDDRVQCALFSLADQAMLIFSHKLSLTVELVNLDNM